MREFFFDLLNELDKLRGLKQLEKIHTAFPDEKEAKQEIKKLIDILCAVSDQFPFIHQNDQKKIIQHGVISDPEFIGLNAGIIYKWLFRNKDKYFKESHHVEHQREAKPLTGKEREEWIKKWNESLAAFPMHKRLEGEALEVEKKKVDGLRAWMSQKSPIPIDREFVSAAELENHRRYIRENYDKYTGKPLDTWISEEEWIKKQTAF